MKTTHRAIKSHGKCALCPKQIKYGDRYVRLVRHATEDERNNVAVKTFSLPGRGPHVEIKYHERSVIHPGTLHNRPQRG